MIVYEGRVFTLEVSTVKFPDGRSHQQEFIRHRPSVVLIPMVDPDHVVLIRQFRPTLAREMWELPAGSLDPGESPEHAAARECEEETRLAPHRIERLRGLYPAPGYCDEEMIFFRVSDLRPPPPDSPHKPDDDEDIQVQTFTVADAKEMLARGEIIDLKTAYGLMLI